MYECAAAGSKSLGPSINGDVYMCVENFSSSWVGFQTKVEGSYGSFSGGCSTKCGTRIGQRSWGAYCVPYVVTFSWKVGSSVGPTGKIHPLLSFTYVCR